MSGFSNVKMSCFAAMEVYLRIPVDRDRAFRFNVTEDSEFA
jgi:hypothetical protein